MISAGNRTFFPLAAIWCYTYTDVFVVRNEKKAGNEDEKLGRFFSGGAGSTLL